LQASKAGGAGEATTGAKPGGPSAGQTNKFETQLREHGRESVEKSRETIQKRLDEHREKLSVYQREGGYTSSVEREIRNFERELQAIDQVLGGGQ
jgi:hypothetical protein